MEVHRHAMPVTRGRASTKRRALFAALLFLAIAKSDLRAAAQTLEIATPPNPNIKAGSDITLTVVARGGDVVVEDIVAMVLDDRGGVVKAPFTFTQTRATSEAATSVLLRASGVTTLKVAGKGSVVFLYKSASDEKAKLTATTAWLFTIVPSLAKVTVDARPQAIVRTVPFTDVSINPAEKKYCLTVVPAAFDQSLAIGSTFIGSIFGADGTKLPNVELTGVVADNNRLCIGTTIPGAYTEAKGKLWLRPPAVQEAVDVDVDLRVKDSVFWRAAAALFATVLAWLFLYWSNTVRRRLINQNRRDTVASRVALFVANNPDLANHPNVIVIRQAILDSKLHDEMGEFDLSSQDLQLAETRFDLLPAAGTGAKDGLAIAVSNETERLLVGRPIKFRLVRLNPETAGETFAWTVTKAGTRAGEQSDGNLTEFEFTFRTPGVFEIKVAFGETVVIRQITILKEPAPSLVDRFRLVQVGTALATLALAFGTAYLMTDAAATFGTVGDYIKLVGSAFGVSSGISSVAAVITSVRGR